MSQWPQRDEMEKIKDLRQQYRVLNESASSIPNSPIKKGAHQAAVKGTVGQQANMLPLMMSTTSNIHLL